MMKATEGSEAVLYSTLPTGRFGAEVSQGGFAALASLSILLVCSAALGEGGRDQLSPPVRFGVISDPHLYDVRLGTTGAAFEAYLDQDPKLLRESEPILDAVLGTIVSEGVHFLIVCGDLTKDGEVRDHVLMSQHLAKLEQQGVAVFVVPGNHDINNPDAVAYVGETTRSVANLKPEQFLALYQRFGYGEAVTRDKHSLSYVAEPVPGVWLLAIDSCKYAESAQLGYPVVGGRIAPETMAWIAGVMQTAQANGKRVLAFMHHGVNQHFFGEELLFGDYLVDDWVTTSLQLASTGLKVVFTGHYHAQDAAYLVDQSLTPLSPLCDVETSSLVQYPCAFRVATLEANGTLHIESRWVTEVDADTDGMPFHDYARQAFADRLPNIIIARLMAMFPTISPEEAAFVTPLVADAIIANNAGDETPTPEIVAIIEALINSPDPLHTLGLMLQSFWLDLPPQDNELDLSLDAD